MTFYAIVPGTEKIIGENSLSLKGPDRAAYNFQGNRCFNYIQ